MYKNKGFTLIELLVVIAIIGILSSVVLASLNTARTKAKDAAVKSQLASMRAQAELYYNSNTANPNSYTGLCNATQANSGLGGTGGPGLLKATKDSDAITSTIGVTLTTAGDWNIVTCHDSANAWAAEAPMSDSASGAPKMYCVDSTSASKSVSGILIASDVIC